ncbi:isocitrate lyase/phosphoenolpyruvate mutase family protein [Pseudoduganella ginsengisoli]|uniref:Isocitrate lyase/phosphoenolpyruvate mutase family protein n=1 Tax=Pseudoduganella ginsengisoli TaxID=1462440 RepID=A0A6L6Q7S0_9BURK|nr:isocitrate lyase/phosphoenolpyruvate mutase family protein [Pseudoduganella ginsengisoli]MTW05222.1 isocitrate lyase/phosphoenolpyruvate mutase family protein [Pseudoduganella ginsengisoli]
MTARHDQQFHALHSAGLLLLANCWDAGTARLAMHAGSKALATSSAAVAWAHGYADGGKLPPGLLLSTIRAIVRVADLPLTADIENGYSDDPAAVAALGRDVVRAGAVGINIEDGNDAPELLCEKIAGIRRAATEEGVNLYINARTDSFLRPLVAPEQRVAEVLRRAALYREAGASGLFAPGVREEADIEAIAKGCGMPLNILVRPGFPSTERLQALGVRRLSAGSDIAEMADSYIVHAMREFLRCGAIAPHGAPALTYPQLNELMASGRG